MGNNNEMTLQRVLEILEKRIDAFATASEAADYFGVSYSYLSEVRSGKERPGKKILDALGIEHLDKYRWKKKS
jgi:transcriptional regulator with XRE-family HTH domain